MIVTPGSFFFCGLVLVRVSIPFFTDAFHSATDLSEFSISTVDVVSLVLKRACCEPIGWPVLTNFPSSLKYSEPGFTFFAFGVIFVIVQCPFKESSRFWANALCKLASNTAIMSNRFIQVFFLSKRKTPCHARNALFMSEGNEKGEKFPQNLCCLLTVDATFIYLFTC